MSFVVASPAQSNQILYLILLLLTLLAELAPGFYVVYVLSRSVTHPAHYLCLMGVSVIIEVNTDMVLHYSNPSPSTSGFTLSFTNADIPLRRFKATSGLCPSHSEAFSLSGIWNCSQSFIG